VPVDRRALGAKGEARVARWYEEQGYEVVGRNWRCRDGELDLIVRRGAVLVFCEVKTRSSTRFGVPAEAVTRAKVSRLRRLAARWLAEHADARAADIRFDVAGILGSTVDVIEAAF
jgi:putative endonuclease